MAKLRCTMVADPNQGRTVNGIVNRYGYKVEDGEKVFDKIGEIDAQADIQSYLESCDYRLIMESICKQIGGSLNDFDFDSFNTLVSGIDVSDPISVASYMEILQDEFGALPKEIKEHYENNPRLFARDCVGGGAVDFINTLRKSHDGSQQTVENPASGETVGEPGGQPDIAGIMRQIDAINQKLGAAEKGDE